MRLAGRRWRVRSLLETVRFREPCKGRSGMWQSLEMQALWPGLWRFGKIRACDSPGERQ